jgi:hypothetical protein
VSNPCPQINPELPAAPPQQLHARFLAALPRIRAHAEVRFRGVRCPHAREDAVADVLASAWEALLLRRADGLPLPGAAALARLALRRARTSRP